MRLRVVSLVIVAFLAAACAEEETQDVTVRSASTGGKGGASGGSGNAGRSGATAGGAAGSAGKGTAGAGQAGTSSGSGGTSAGGAGAGAAGAAGGVLAGNGGAGTGGTGGAVGGSGGGTSGGSSGAFGGAAAGGSGGGAAGAASGGAAGQASGGGAGAASGGMASGGGAGEASGGAAGGPVADPFTYAYQENGNFVRYRTLPNVFEKTTGLVRDKDRKLMPIDLHSWSIANFSRNRLMYADYRLQDGSGQVIFEVHDTEGAVHVALAQNERENARGNNHQAAFADFLIAEGEYTVVFTLLPNSVGRPSLILWRQRPENLFTVLVGASPSSAEKTGLDGSDGYLVNFNETVSRTFAITYLDQDNALYKSNANGFEND